MSSRILPRHEQRLPRSPSPLPLSLPFLPVHHTDFRSKAFVLHIRHATLTIFHAHFPHAYLSNINTHGAQYSSLFPHEAKIHLRQSRAYNMRLASDQAALYSFLARLFWFLSSGRSHVGYLANCPGNPFIAKEVCTLSLALVPRFFCGRWLMILA